MTFRTEQEAFRAGTFGTEYIDRNQGDALLASNLDFFAKALRATRGIKSCVEFDANIGLNLKAMKLLYPACEMHGIEINADAARELAQSSRKTACATVPSWTSVPGLLVSTGATPTSRKTI